MGARTRGLANNVLSSGKLDATDAVSGVIPASNIADASLTSATSFGSVTGGVPQVASDPPSPSEGDVWYNTTTGQIKFRTKINSWASGGNLNTAKNSLGGAGTQTAGLAFGSFPVSATTESYDGTSWTEVNDLNTGGGYFVGAFGTNTAAIAAGRLVSPTGRQGNTESWDGTNWTEVNDLNTTRTQGAGFGTSTAGLVAAGGTPSQVTNVESWNGTSWTEITDVNTARYELGGNGIQTSGLIYGGETGAPSRVGSTESWNGSTWTEVSDLNTGRQSNRGVGLSNTNGLSIGGSTGSAVALTESFDGTSWTEVSDLTNARVNMGNSGPSNTTAMVAGGGPSTYTEEWSGVDTTTIVG